MLMDKYRHAGNWKYMFQDLDRFLDQLPLMIHKKTIGLVIFFWILASVFLLLVFVKSKELNELKLEMTRAEALRPSLPVIDQKPINAGSLRDKIDPLKTQFNDLTINVTGNGRVTVMAKETSDYPRWLAAIHQIMNLNKNWRVDVKSICAGRECTGQVFQIELDIVHVMVSIKN